MNLPANFIERTKSLLRNDWNDFLNALQEEAPISIRFNRKKVSKSELDNHVLWNQNGYYLDTRPQFTFDPLLHAGCYYVQEASSMFIEQAIRQFADNDIKVLDLCAAPGGKSTIIADSISENCLLVSNEVIRSRSNILAENMIKWGNANVVVTNNDPSDYTKLNGFFDVILVDAPCSGEGMFRKDTGAIKEWSVDNVKLCKERQQRVLADVWPALKTGGVLIYSTCTYNLEENEENVKWMIEELGAEALSIDIEDKWNIMPSFVDGIIAYRFFPHKTKGEGFFCAAVRKTGDEQQTMPNKKGKGNKKDRKVELPSQYKDYIKGKEGFTFYPKGNSWFAVPTHLYEDIQTLQSEVNVISEGITLGEFKGKDFIPSQSLALSNMLNWDAFNICDVNWVTAISYLRKEALVLPDQPKGYLLLTYQDKPLGFVKNIGNRANNLYPQEWRIRSGNIPEKVVRVL